MIMAVLNLLKLEMQALMHAKIGHMMQNMNSLNAKTMMEPTFYMMMALLSSIVLTRLMAGLRKEPIFISTNTLKITMMNSTDGTTKAIHTSPMIFRIGTLILTESMIQASGMTTMEITITLPMMMIMKNTRLALKM